MREKFFNGDYFFTKKKLILIGQLTLRQQQQLEQSKLPAFTFSTVSDEEDDEYCVEDGGAFQGSVYSVKSCFCV